MTIFNNIYLIKKVFSYLSEKLTYININPLINEYLFNTVRVEFSIIKYIQWLIKYFKLDIQQVNKKFIHHRADMLKYLQITYYKHLTVKLIEDTNHHNQSMIELSNKLIVYLLFPNLSFLYLYFPTVENLIINKQSYNPINLISLNSLKYLNCYHTLINNLPCNNLQTLIIDVRNLPLNIEFTNLKYLKILSLEFSGYNFTKFIKIFNQSLLTFFPSLQVLYLDFLNESSPILLTNMLNLSEVYTHYPNMIKVSQNTICYEINSSTNDQSNKYFTVF